MNKESGNELQNSLYIILPEDIDSKYLQDCGGTYCILDMNTWQMYSHTKRNVHTPVFCNISADGKLYEHEESARRTAKRLLNNNPKMRLCITYYGIALSTYYKTGLSIKNFVNQQA